MDKHSQSVIDSTTMSQTTIITVGIEFYQRNEKRSGRKINI